MKIKQLEIKRFRCFSSFVMECNSSQVIIVGKNGSGKTSLFEALHYLCYLRSFRTHKTKELIKFDSNDFFVKISFDDLAMEQHVLQVGFSSKKKIVKLNKKQVTSYKDLLDYYRVVTLTEDDLMLIKGLPDGRRLFLNKALFLINHKYVETLKKYKHVLQNRNAVLQSAVICGESYDLWTEQLFELNKFLVQVRVGWINSLEKEVQLILAEFFEPGLFVKIVYQQKLSVLEYKCYQEFIKNTDVFNSLYKQESFLKRTMFGAHLDDIGFYFMDKRARHYASRGQQKLFVLLIKIAQIRMMKEYKGAILFLLDDFVNDFDEVRLKEIVKLLSALRCQKIFSSPVSINIDKMRDGEGSPMQILQITDA